MVEDGAVPDDATDNLASFQATLDAVAAAGGGIALVPAGGRFFWRGTLTVPHRVILRGLGTCSALRARPGVNNPAVRFAPGAHRGGLESLVLVGDAHRGLGIDLSGAQFLRLRDFEVWTFGVGLLMSDGRTSFAGYNHVADFEVNSCWTGVRAWEHCNQGSIREGRIHFCRNNGKGVAIDIDAATALTMAHVAVEDFDLGVRIRGRTSVSLRDVYYEADVPRSGLVQGAWMDIRPDRGSIVRMDNSHAGVSRSVVMGGSLEDAVTTDERSHVFDGAKRHHAAAPERNLVENGDFHRADGLTIPGWGLNFAPDLAENTDDFVTGGRSYDVRQNGNPNDGIRTAFVVPETTDYVTVMVRYKNVSSTSLLFRVVSGGNAALYVDPVPPSRDWRVAAITVAVDQSAAGAVHAILTADQEGAAGQIRVDELWAVVGATAAPPRAHAHRIEFLPEPVTVVERAALTGDATFGPTDLTSLPGLGGAPRGVVGAVLALRGSATPGGGNGGFLDPSGIGAALPRALRPFVEEPSSRQRWRLDIVFDRLEHDRQVALRSTSFVDGIHAFDDAMAVTYRVDVVGWVLPS